MSDNRKAGKYPASLRNGVDESDRAYKWLHNKAKVSPEHVGSIVTATGGVVKAYQIRPDLPKLFPHTEKNAA
ncbi:YdaS family helix-turn-helix protein [Escherichia coli]|uniref:transcriptional regulator n=1 Tax=Escherichia coli TaxID=562 RepID=UPI0006ACCDE9